MPNLNFAEGFAFYIKHVFGIYSHQPVPFEFVIDYSR